MRTLAGLAGNQRSSPENGSLPKRFFFAGTACTTIFRRPDSVNSPAPFLWTAPRIVSSSAASTALAALGSTAARSATCAASEAFVKVSLIGDGAPDAFTATFLAATAFFAGTFFAATFLVGTGQQPSWPPFLRKSACFSYLLWSVNCKKRSRNAHASRPDSTSANSVLRDSFVYKRYGLLRGADSATLFNPCFRG